METGVEDIALIDFVERALQMNDQSQLEENCVVGVVVAELEQQVHDVNEQQVVHVVSSVGKQQQNDHVPARSGDFLDVLFLLLLLENGQSLVESQNECVLHQLEMVWQLV